MVLSAPSVWFEVKVFVCWCLSTPVMCVCVRERGSERCRNGEQETLLFVFENGSKAERIKEKKPCLGYFIVSIKLLNSLNLLIH